MALSSSVSASVSNNVSIGVGPKVPKSNVLAAAAASVGAAVSSAAADTVGCAVVSVPVASVGCAVISVAVLVVGCAVVVPAGTGTGTSAEVPVVGLAVSSWKVGGWVLSNANCGELLPVKTCVPTPVPSNIKAIKAKKLDQEKETREHSP